ncbi:MAG: hydrogenase formation protein HypD [Hyphomonadaceae bacterium]
MKYVDEFRDGRLARALAAEIGRASQEKESYRLMEFCGGHTHAIARYGLEDLLPGNVRMIHGPGCPVCVLPMGRMDDAIAIARQPGTILCVYGDLMRVPGSQGASLWKARAAGADVRMVYAPQDVLSIAEAHPGREVVFFAIGFETTTPPTALLAKEARARGLPNLSIFCNHVMTPPAMRGILAADALIDGFVGPSHVSTIIGAAPYEEFSGPSGRPVVIAGFEPVDVLQAILMLIRQLNEGRSEVENQYKRAVGRMGNQRALELMDEVFCIRESFEWRGLGFLPASARALRPEFAEFDAERRFATPGLRASDNPACECAAILRGQKQPRECKLFGGACTPETPMGSCMVSSEGACAAHWTYGRFREEALA